MMARSTLAVSRRLIRSPFILGFTPVSHVLENHSIALGSAGHEVAALAPRVLGLGTSAPMRQWRTTMSQTEIPRPSESYHIQIVTGSVRGAGSPTPAVLQLFGENGESEPYLLGSEDGAEKGFKIRSRKTYMIKAPNLGPLTRIAIRQAEPEESDSESDSDDSDSDDDDDDNNGPSSNGHSGWYLERVVVIGPDGESWSFPFNDWIGRASSSSSISGTFGQSQGCAEHTLVLQSMQLSSMRDPRYNYKSHPLEVQASAFSVPHPSKVAEGSRGVNRRWEGYAGEDAYFVTAAGESASGVVAFGVSDGVYEWRERGVDAGAFSRGLVAGVAGAVRRGETDPVAALRSASEELRAAATRGSATACLVFVDMRAGVMRAANLGDSGWMLLTPGAGKRGPAARRRPRVLQARSPQQEHEFGRPFQLGSQATADSADDAMQTTLPLLPGSTIVLGSDGLFDNLDDGAIVRLVDDALDEGHRPSEVARELVFAAFQASVDKERDTPYSRAAREALDMVFHGGKRDDITALVAVVH